MKQVYTYVILIVLGLITACQPDNKTPELPEITVGDGNVTVIKIDKNSTIDLKLAGGNGKFRAVIQESKIAVVEIIGEYLKITGLQYGETKLAITSQDKRLELTIKVERPEFNIEKTEVQLYPGDTEYVVKVTGGGDDGTIEVDDPEKALEYRWNANNNILLTAKHEGVATIKFISKDDKPAKTLTVKIIAEDPNGLSEMVGVYGTTSRSLYSLMPTVLTGYRKGKNVWICGSTKLGSTYKRVEFKPLSSPKVGEVVTMDMVFISVNNFQSGSHDLVIEKVQSDRGLVILRGQGFKIVAPYDR